MALIYPLEGNLIWKAEEKNTIGGIP